MRAIHLTFRENYRIINSVSIENNQHFKIGRNENNYIRFALKIVSGYHAELKFENNQLYIKDVGSTNGTFINNEKIEPHQWIKLNNTDNASFDKSNFTQLKIDKESIDSEKTSANTNKNSSATKSKKIIGRGSDCDIILPNDKYVSRIHASLEKIDENQYELRDLQSSNGVYVNGKKILVAQLKENDVFFIGRTCVSVTGEIKNLDQATAIKLNNISKSFGKANVLNNLTLQIEPNSLTAIMGPSGCGKSTLFHIMLGLTECSAGNIALFDLDASKHFEYIKSQIGYVPQIDTIHQELTVYQSIYFAAKLRLEHKTEEEIKSKIAFLLKKLGIDHIQDNLNSAISGGQRKRVCIAIELLSDPMILFLDEPTSPLDPQTIEEFLLLLKDLTRENTTIVMVTHKPEDLEYMDEVVFLTVGGFLAYKGKTAGYKSHFNVQSAVGVYQQLSGSNANKWKTTQSSIPTSKTEGSLDRFSKPSVKWWHQFYWLTIRNIRTKTNDRKNTQLLIGQAPIIALLIGFIFNELSISVLFMMSVSAIWFGVNNSCREIVKESKIYERESMFNVRRDTYLLSKISTLAIISFIQSVLFVGILSLFYLNKDVHFNHIVYQMLFMFFLSITASLLGLLVSASLKSTEKVMALVPILLIPQLMLAGLVTKITNPIIELLSWLTISRWGTEGLANLQATIQNTHLNKKDNAILYLKGQFHATYTDVFGSQATSFGLGTTFLASMLITLYIVSYYKLGKK
jgi:ABC-type multidrug transport system ATPase subunit